MKKVIVLALIFLGALAQEYEPYDGFFNNLGNPEYGAEDSAMLRRLPAHYADGAGALVTDRPNPRALSEATQKGDTGQGSYLNRTALLVFFGQQVVEEILDAQDAGCPTEYINIDVPKCDALYDPNCTGIQQIPLFRNRYSRLTGQAPGNPRAMLNEITPWIDGGLMYGKSKAWADALRSFEGGELASDPESNGRFPRVNEAGIPLANPPPPRDHYLKPVKRFFQIGNPRGNENPMLLTMGILWFRNHNYHARRLKGQHPDWDDEELFNRARQWNIAEHQHIVLNRWLPAWINDTVPAYTGYNPTLNPQIVLEFQSAAMRYGHTLVTPGIYRRDATCNFRNTTIATKFEGHIGLRTCNTFWNPQEAVRESDISEILMGLASQIAEREDNIITEDLRGFVFGPLDGNRRDLMAINIQRGRDNGLQDYNTIREFYGLPRIATFAQFAAENPLVPAEAIQGMADLYNNDTSNIDLWVGGILESRPEGPGPLFKAILVEQFTRIRNADRFWYANRLNGLFTDEEIGTIELTELSDIIIRVTNIASTAIQRDVFHHVAGDPCPQPKQLSQFDMENCTLPMTYDYYSISVAHIPVIVWSLIVWAGICLGIVFLSIKCKPRFLPKKAEVPVAVPANRTFKKHTLYGAVELNENQDAIRPVFLELRKKKVTIRDKKDVVLREIFYERISSILRLEQMTDLLLIKVPLEYDLLLQFKDEAAKMDFAEPLLKHISKPVSIVTTKVFFSQMKTKAMRKKELEAFFKRTLESVFSGKKTRELSVEEITLDEFAEVFSLPRNSLFVTQLFNYADTDKNGTVSSQELVKLLAVFYKQDHKDKIRFMFDLYDKTGSGSVDKMEFTNMIKSMLEINNQDIPADEGVADVVASMYEAAGLPDGADVKFEDFQRMTDGFQDLFELVKIRPDAPAPVPSGDRKKNLTRAATVILSKAPNRQATKRQLKKHDTVRSFNPAEKEGSKPSRIMAYLANHRLQIFWLSLYYLTLAAIFAERFYSYAYEREHRGLRRIAGWGIATTRGAASSMMFVFSMLLLSMCKNIHTLLRESLVKDLIPFDNAYDFHIISALTGFTMVAVHNIGHFVNFFSVATEPPSSLACLFREVNWVSDYLPSFSWWLYRTPTGVTGYIATLVIMAMAIFSLGYFRKNFFTPFLILHQVLAFMFYSLGLMHGWAQLVQVPIFHTWLIGPLFLYTVDKLMSIAQLGHSLKIRKAEWLPSDVLHLQFDRPPSFNYKAGQYLQIASAGISTSLFHPFTITSAPHEAYLSLHIRAVGPWTRKARQIYNPNASSYPDVVVTGPFGSEADTWSSCSHVIMVGAGIGVTPFASILKDFVYRAKNDRTLKTRKLIFFWVCKTQKHFEWLVDIIREAEYEDTKGRLEVHIFVTELQQKFDLRTVMLYICEKQFHKVHNTSLFTGLQAATHFGRPNFPDLFTQIQTASPKADKVVVFSCVPKAMLRDVERACDQVNIHSGPKFYHSADGFL